MNYVKQGMVLKNLGFGMMRLPEFKEGKGTTNFDYEQIYKMVDTFLEAGFYYFDTSYVYHNGENEGVVRKVLVERHPRNAFTLATKFPTWAITKEEEIEPIFGNQLENCGVDYFDYYLIHKIETVTYDGIDGNGGVCKTSHLIDHAKKWQADGKVKHLGFSFHSSAKLLDRVLRENPEFEFVQIPLNYYDWDSELVQARKCYDVIRKHGKQVVIMQPVKGGGLGSVPAQAEKLLKDMEPDASVASWAVRFAGSLDGVLAVLSGMSTLEQVQDNIKVMQNAKPLNETEREVLKKVVQICKENGPLQTSDFSKYDGLTLHGAPVSGILDAWNTCQFQPDPGFSTENNYLKNIVAEERHLDLFGELPDEKVILADGTDETDLVLMAEKWLIENSF